MHGQYFFGSNYVILVRLPHYAQLVVVNCFDGMRCLISKCTWISELG